MRIYLSLAISLFLSASALHATITTFSYEGLNSPGNDLAVVITQSRDSCAENCLSNKLCSLAVYDYSTKKCKLKTQASKFEHTEAHALILKIVDGVDGVDYIHGDYSSIQTTTWQRCSRHCFIDDRCLAFTYNKTTGSCFLKDKIVISEHNTNAISGTR